MWIEFPCPAIDPFQVGVGTTAGREVGHQSPPCPRLPAAASSSEQSRDELWLSHAGLAELQRYIVNCLGHIVV